MKRSVFVALLAVAWVLSSSARADGDAAAGLQKSALCAACHGATGTSPNELWPSLAGQGKAYLAKQLKAFRTGTRQDPVMEPMAQPLSDQDIEDLAAYFSAQKLAPVEQ